MRWGVRRDRSRVRSSSEHKRVSELGKKRTHQLTNKQLKTINERKNLEQNYHRLNPGKVARGLAFTGAVLGAAGMGFRVYDMMHHPATKHTLATGKAAMEHRKKLVAARKLAKTTGQLQLFKP